MHKNDIQAIECRQELIPDSTDLADKFIERVQHLPPIPSIATELLGVFKQRNPDIERIVQLIQHDPSLTAEVLKRCNSAWFSRGLSVSDIFAAIIRMGFHEIYYVVLSAVSSRTMSLPQTQCGLDNAMLWEHSVKTAVAAGVCAKHSDEDEAVPFTAGLLHDVGKIIMASAAPSDYAKCIGMAGCHGAAPAGKETEVFGMTHAEVGARLLVRWGFPVEVVLAVLHHHGSPKAAVSYERLAAILNLANGISHLPPEEGTIDPDFAATHSEAMHILQIAPDSLPELLRKTGAGFRRVQELLRLQV